MKIMGVSFDGEGSTNAEPRREDGLTLDTIREAMRKIGDIPPPPFNGADFIHAAEDVFDGIRAAVAALPWGPLTRAPLVIKDRDVPHGYAVGFQGRKVVLIINPPSREGETG